MKKFINLFIIVLPFLSIAQEEVSSKVQEAKVFLNNALLTHVSSANISAGVSTIVVKGFPSNIDQNSIQVKGTGAFTLLSVAFEKDFLSSKTAALEDSIKLVKEKIEELQLDKMVLEKEERMLMANANIKSETDGVSTKELEDMQSYFRQNLKRIGKESLLIVRKIEVLENERANLQNQLNATKSQNQPLGMLTLKVKSERRTKANFEISYMAYNCGWSPNYDIRVKDIASPADVTYKALVYQNTGIDWTNVKLNLSTSNPNQSSIKPEIYPQYLSFYAPPVMNARVKAESAPMADALQGRVAGVELMEMKSMDQYVEMTETTLDLNFKIEIPYTINSGKKAEEVEIVNATLPATYNYFVVPKFNTDAYLVATLKDWEKYNFLPGQMNVYFEDAFVGKSYMPTLKADDELDVSLGRDARIVAERKELTDYKSKKTFGSNIRQDFKYRLEIKNNRSQAVRVFMEDQYPISQDSEIIVSLAANGAAEEPEKGKLTWELNIAPNGKETKEFGYEVKYPKDKIINNL